MDMPETFKERAQDWLDPSSMAYNLADVLGLVPFLPEWGFHSIKGVFWETNPIGDFLEGTIERLTMLGVLESKGSKYRWNPAFAGAWEKTLKERLDQVREQPEKKEVVQAWEKQFRRAGSFPKKSAN